MAVSTILRAIVVIVVLREAQSALYPSTYPFENENIDMPELIESTPDETFIPETDPGGYSRRNLYCNLNDPDFFDVWKANYYDFCAYNTYYVATIQEIPTGYTGLEDVNCSDRPLLGPDTAFTGRVNGKTICTEGECCSETYGNNEYAGDYPALHSIWDTQDASGLCATMNLPTYCVVMNNWAYLCIQHYLDAGTRTFIIGCYDATYRHLLTCPAYVAAGVAELAGGEDTLTYMARSTSEQQMVMLSLGYHGDRVCFPYSYYYPEAAKDSTSASASDGDDNNNSDDGNNSASLAAFGGAAVFMASTALCY